MDKILINQHAFEIFARTMIFDAEFKVFKTQKWLDYVSGQTNDKSVILEHQSRLGAANRALEELKTQIEEFRKLKQINN